MAISSMCEHCFGTFSASAKAAGKRIACPLCREGTVVHPIASDSENSSLSKKRTNSAVATADERPRHNKPKKVATAKTATKSTGKKSSRAAVGFDLSGLVGPVAALFGLAVLGLSVWYFAPGAGRVRAQKTFAAEHGEPRTTKSWLEFIRSDERQKEQARAKGQKHTFGEVLRKHVGGDPKQVIGPDPAAIPDLFEALGDDQPRRVQEVAEAVLQKFVTSSEKPFSEDVKAGINHANPRVRNWATRLLAMLEPEAKQMASELVKTLETGDSVAATNAANTLATTGSDGLPALTAALDKPDDKVVAVVIRAIGRMGETATPSVPKIASFLGHEKRGLRTAALDALEALGSSAKAAVPDLVSVLEASKFDDEILRVTKLLAKPELESTDAVIRLLDAGAVRTQKRAVSVLSAMNQFAAPAEPALSKIASQPADDAEHRDLQQAVSRLLAKLKSGNLPENAAERAAIVALGPLEPAVPPPVGVIEALEEMTPQILKTRIAGKQVGETKSTADIGGSRGQFGVYADVTEFFDEQTQTKAQRSRRRVNEMKKVDANDPRRRTDAKLDQDLTSGKSVREVVEREDIETLSWSQGDQSYSGRFEDGKREGRWLRKHPNGQVWVVGAYHQDQKIGQFSVRDPEGKRLWVGRYLRGELVGFPKRDANARFQLLPLDSEPTLVRFDPIGKRLAVAQGDLLTLYDVETWEESGCSIFSNAIQEMEFSRNGLSLLVTLAIDKLTTKAIVCDAATGDSKLELSSEMSQPSLSHNGRLVAGFRRDQNNNKELLIYDLQTGQAISSPQRTEDDSFAFSADDLWLAVGGKASTIVLDVNNGKLHQRYDLALSNVTFAMNDQWLLGATRTGQRAKIDRLTGIGSGFGWKAGSEAKVTPDGHFLVECYHKRSKGRFSILEQAVSVNLRTGQEVLSQHFLGDFPSVMVSSNGQTLAQVANKGGHVWSLRTGESLKKLPALFTGTLSDDGRLLAAFETEFRSGSHRVQIIDLLSDKREVVELPAARSELASPILFSPDAKWLVACQRGSLSVWNTAGISKAPEAVAAAVQQAPAHVERFDDWSVVVTRQPDVKFSNNIGHSNLEPAYYGFVLSADRKRLLAHNASFFRVWQSEGNPKTTVSSVQPSNHGRAVLSPDGKTLCCGNQNGALNFWDMKKGEPLPVPKSEPSQGGIRQVCFSPDGKLVASADGPAKTARLWDTSKRTIQKKLMMHRHDVLGTAFGGSNSQLATLDSGGNFLIHNTEDDSPVSLKLTSESSFDQLYSLPATRHWLVLRYQHGANLTFIPFDAPHTPVEMSLKLSQLDNSIPTGCSISSDEGFAAIASEARVILVNLKERRISRVLHGHLGSVVGVAFTPDDRHLITSGQDGVLRVWGAEPFPFPLDAPLPSSKDAGPVKAKTKKK